jgi:PIN domain nuclease of toxin-antitoxin system
VRCLLDTHTLLWAVEDSPRLSLRARTLWADEKNDFFVSAASAFELATKYRLGKLPEAGRLLSSFDERVTSGGMEAVAITTAHAKLAGMLRAAHKDPFDRILAAQALMERLVLVSNDEALDQFGVERVW